MQDGGSGREAQEGGEMYIYIYSTLFGGFPGDSDSKESTCNADLVSIPGLGKSPGDGNSNPLQCSCLENPVDREACACSLGYSACGHKESDRTDVTKQAHS